MKGHIRERSPGHWGIVLDVRDAATGKRKRRWHSFCGTKRAAQIECARLISELNGGTYLEPNKATVAQFLDRWLDHVKIQVAPRTHERYVELAKKSIAPLIGNVVLTKLQPATISAAYSKALAEGRRDGKGGLSPRTVGHMHRVLRQALQQAVRWQLLARNPADVVDPPRTERTAMQTYDLAETGTLLNVMRGTRMFVPTLLAVLCGLRRGEIAALRWRNVDLAAGRLSVVESAEHTRAGVRYKEPKSGRSRTVALSSTVIAELRLHRARQAEELLRIGIRLNDDGFMAAKADGNPVHPMTLTQEWRRLVRKSGLPPIRLHDLRHAHATHMLAAGVHPKVASERLGHSRVGITLDLYSHVSEGMQQEAAERVDAALQAVLNKQGPAAKW